MNNFIDMTTCRLIKHWLYFTGSLGLLSLIVAYALLIREFWFFVGIAVVFAIIVIGVYNIIQEGREEERFKKRAASNAMGKP